MPHLSSSTLPQTHAVNRSFPIIRSVFGWSIEDPQVLFWKKAKKKPKN